MRRTAILASLGLFLSQCGSNEAPNGVTAVRVLPTFQNEWSLNQLVLEAGERTTAVPEQPGRVTSGESILILMRDDAAGQRVDLAVWGMADGKRIARGTTAFTPTLHQAIDVPVELALVPCEAWCSPGTKVCEGDGVKECVVRDGEACPTWSDEKPCPSDEPYCSAGRCAATCVDECAEASTQCAGATALQRCGQADSDECLDWMPEELCEGGTRCESGLCTAAPCTDECAAGEKACANGGTTVCGNHDTDSCLEWGPPAACPTGQTCSNGVCSATCTDECSASSCSGTTWKQCGQYDLDECLESSAGISCAATDACHVGSCNASGGCSSVALECDTPPIPQCASSTTLRIYSAAGTCGAAGCSYPSTETPCPAPANGTAQCSDAFCGFSCNAGYEKSGTTCQPITPTTGWTTLPSGTTQGLFGVGGAGGKVWAAGYGTANVVLARNGATWTQSTVASWPYGVWAASATDIYVVGAQIFHSSTGAAWGIQTAPNQGRYGVWGSSATNVYAVGSSGSLVRTTGNGTWTAQSTGTGNHLNGIWGSSASDLYIVGDKGTILHSTGNGTWTPQTSGTTDDLQAVWGSGPSDVYIAGWGGRIMRSTGNGVWASQNPTNRSFYGVWGSSSSDIYVVGSQGTVYHSTGDDVWTAQTSGTPQDLHAIWGSGPNDVYAVGDNGTIIHRP